MAIVGKVLHRRGLEVKYGIQGRYGVGGHFFYIA